jgi:hypothetical protein
MEQACRQHDCRLLVVLIPTKESVFAYHLLRNPRLPLREVVADLVANERQASAALRGFLDDARIPYVDTLPALRRQLGDHLYAASDRDMHPSRNGYRVIGETVAVFLRDKL